MNSYATLDDIVKQALIANGEESLHKYPRYLLFAMEAAKEFNYDSSGDVKTVRLTMDDVKQIEMPVDFVDWVKVGVQIGDMIKVMGVKDTLPILTERDSCGALKPYPSTVAANDFPDFWQGYGGYYFLNYTNEWGEFTGGIYGIGGGYTDVGYFRVLRNQGERAVLQFNSDVNNTDVYIEYISNGFDPKQETVVNSYAEKAIQFYIHWRVSWHKYGAAAANTIQCRQEYYDELKKARVRISGLTTRDILEISRKYYMQAPKY